jgi:predicted nucleotidyltransferase
MKRFTPGYLDALRELRALWPQHRLVLIGASALGCFLEMRWRKTHDLDLSVSIAPSEFPAGLDARRNWVEDPHTPHRWISPQGVRVDFVPADPETIRARRLEWPDGFVMNLVGFRLVFEHPITVQLAEDLEFDVAGLPVIALLKMAAYLDRPYARQDDLSDIGFILSEGIDANDEDRYSDEMRSKNLTYDLAAPYLIGRRLGRMADEEEKELAGRFVVKALDEEDAHQTHVRLARFGPRAWQRTPRIMVSCLKAFRDGLAVQ